MSYNEGENLKLNLNMKEKCFISFLHNKFDFLFNFQSLKLTYVYSKEKIKVLLFLVFRIRMFRIKL